MRYLLCLLLALTVLVAADSGRIAFLRGGDLWTANLDGSDVKYLYNGTEADLTEDGTKAVFITNDAVQTGDDRRLATATLPDGKVTVLSGIPTKNCLNPAWSPDATQIAFSPFDGSTWNVAVVNADGTGFRVLRPDCCGPRWAPDGLSVYVNDLDSVLQLDLAGQVLHGWKIATLVPGWYLSSASGLDISPDGRTLLVELLHGEEPKTIAAIWRINLHTTQALRLVDGFGPRWVSPTDFVYTAATKGQESIYRMGPKGKTLLLKNAAAPGT